MRHGNAGELGRGDRRTEARHHLEGNAGVRQSDGFLGAAAKDERVAAFQPNTRFRCLAARIISR
jgi:hypothetical protein